MKLRRVITALVIVLVVVAIAGSVVAYVTLDKSLTVPSVASTLYEFKVNNQRSNTILEVTKNGEPYRTLSETLRRFKEKPIKLLDSSGQEIGYSQEPENLFKLYDHPIYVNNEFAYRLNREKGVFTSHYCLYDEQGNVQGELKISAYNTIGGLYNKNGEVVAKFSSHLTKKDFQVEVFENCNYDESVVLLIIGSYYHDFVFENNRANASH